MTSTEKPKPKPSDVRKWAVEKGMTTSTHGRLSRTIREAYDAAVLERAGQ